MLGVGEGSPCTQDPGPNTHHSSLITLMDKAVEKMVKANTVREARYRRHERVRKRVEGTPERPRLSVFRSLGHIYAQVIDDRHGATLAAASSLEPDIKTKVSEENKIAIARIVGRRVAERAREKGITQVVFDRGGYLYHGRVKALAEGAREGGLQF